MLRLWYWFKDLLAGRPELGGLRSSRWASVRREFLKLNPECAVCRRRGSLLKPLNVHHKVLFSVDPSLELAESNLIVLCPEHHLLFGHLMNFKTGNPRVEQDAHEWRQRIENRP